MATDTATALRIGDTPYPDTAAILDEIQGHGLRRNSYGLGGTGPTGKKVFSTEAPRTRGKSLLVISAETAIFVEAWDSSVCGTCYQFAIHVIWSSNKVCT